MRSSNNLEWKVFISYASEDRERVVKPLVEALKKLGITLWYDQFELKLGDSLHQKIDDGLANCTFGIVVLSPSFFNKHFPKRELSGLAQREVDGNKVILPVWYDIDEKSVRNFSPPLADRIAARWNDGMDKVVDMILDVVRPRSSKKQLGGNSSDEHLSINAPAIVWRLPRGFLLLEDLIKNEYTAWATTADYFHYPLEWIGGTHYHESYRWEDERPNIQFNKLNIQRGDWRYANIPVDLMQRIRKGNATMTRKGELLNYDISRELEMGIAIIYSGQTVPKQQRPKIYDKKAISGPLRDIRSEIENIRMELVEIEVKRGTVQEGMMRNILRQRRACRLEVSELLPKEHPASINLKEVVEKFTSEWDLRTLVSWIGELDETLSEAIGSVEDMD